MTSLECNFHRVNLDKILCTWNEPEYPNGPVRYYYVSLMHEEKTLYGFQTPNRSAEIYINQHEDGDYLVGVNAMTHMWSAGAGTYVKHPKRGESSLVHIMKKNNVNEKNF